uniref:Uncharacterized protein n=1 Tax=Anser cygnoides TaxID=8845 RepID=A0A8B9EF90_ANSCY
NFMQQELKEIVLALLSPLVLPESSQNIWLMVRFCRAAISEIMSLDLRRSSICTDCHRPKDTGQKKNHCFDSCLFAVLQLTRKMIHLSMGKAKCSHNGDQDSKALPPPKESSPHG